MRGVYGGLIKQISRLCLIDNARQFTVASSPLLFRATLPLGAEPMKKKKKVDVNILHQKELRKMRKLEKAIKRQTSKGQQLKPIEEIEGDRSVLKTLDKRKREAVALSFEESERRAALLKDWSRYRLLQFNDEMRAISSLVESQQRALDELRKESEELYQQAIEVDESLIPFEHRGPVETPPIQGYTAPDGDYIDTTPKFNK